MRRSSKHPLERTAINQVISAALRHAGGSREQVKNRLKQTPGAAFRGAFKTELAVVGE
jgi:hypothetical protein